MTGGVFYVAGNLALGTAAWLIGNLVMEGRETWRCLLATLTGFAILVVLELLVLGNLAILTPAAVTVTSGGILGAILLFHRGRARRTLPRIGDPNPLAADRLLRSFEWRIPFVLLAFFLGPLLGRLALGPTIFHFDDYTYHATGPAQWLVDQRISLAPFDYHAHFPLNAELFALWFILPLRGDALASLTSFYWIVVLLVATYGIGRAAGLTSSQALWVLVLLVSAAPLLGMTRTFSAHDLAPVAALLAAVAFSADGRMLDRPHPRVFDAGYAGLMVGFATGCRVTFLPMGLLIFLRWALYPPTGFTRAQRISTASLFLCGWAVLGSFWYLRNLALTGNPLFPAAVGPFDGPFGPEQQYHTSLRRFLVARPGRFSEVVSQVTDWPWGLWVLSAVGYLATLGRMLHRWRRERVTNADLVLLLLLGLVFMVQFPFAPFSGTVNEPAAPLTVFRRYLLVPFVIGLLGFGFSAPQASRLRWVWRAAACGALVQAALVDEGSNIPIGIAFAGVAALTMWKLPGVIAYLGHRVAPLTVGPVILLVTLAVAPLKQGMTNNALWRYVNRQRPIGRAWEALESLPPGARIAWFGPLANQYYPLYGRHFQLTPWPVNTDGTAFQPVYLAWKAGVFRWWGPGPVPEKKTLIQNLITAGATYVLVTRGGLPSWPPQQEMIETSTRAMPVYQDQNTTIWKLKAQTDTLRSDP